MQIEAPQCRTKIRYVSFYAYLGIGSKCQSGSHMTGSEESYTLKETAKILKVHEDTLRRRIRAGEIETFRIGKQIRIRKDVLDKLMGKK
jgi:excisionase family DNA binding protein